jgi:hypothetical protein
MAGSGRPDSKQVKILGSDSSQMTHGYWTQQSNQPPPGSTVQHPLAPTKIVSLSAEQQQALQDKAGA